MHIVGGLRMRIGSGFTVRTLGGFHANSHYSSGEGNRYSGGGRSGSGSSRPRWSRASSTVSYTPA